jgi:2-polyprenyl-6-methoxyphenol hydroxylase-like FAD-dependent oxidoreductase
VPNSPNSGWASAWVPSERSVCSLLLHDLTDTFHSTLRAFDLLGVLNTFRDVAELLPAGSIWARYLAHEDSTEVADVRFAGEAAFMHRKRVLEALVTQLPPNVRTHFSARIVGVSDVAGGARVRLEVAPAKDKREHPPVEALEVDAVIGADGIRSSIREKIFPGARARWTGMYGYRNLLPMHEAEGILGPMAHQACVWMGPGRVSSFPHAAARRLRTRTCSTSPASRLRGARSSTSSRASASATSRWPSACGTGRGSSPATARRC